MKISHLKFKNVFSINELEFTPNSFNRIVGKNGAGKSNVLKALKLLFGGGTQEAILKTGEDSGEIVAVIEEGDDEIRARRGITDKGIQPVSIKSAKEGPIKRAQEWLDQRIDAVSINPAAFLYADESKRTQMFLEIVPTTVTAEQLGAALGKVVPEDQAAGNGLDVIKAWAKKIFDERAAVNRIAKEKRATANQLRESLPKEDLGTVAAEMEAVRTRIAEIGSQLAADTEEANRLFSVNRQEIQDAAAGEIADLEDQVRKLQDKIAAKRSDVALKLEKAKTAIGAKLQAIKDAAAEEMATLRAKESGLTEKSKQLERGRATLDHIKAQERDAEANEEKSREYSKVLERLDALKGELIKGIPIDGVAPEDGVLKIDGLPLANASTGELWKRVIIPLAVMRAGEKGVVFLDHAMDALDEENRQMFIEAAKGTDLQWFVTDKDDSNATDTVQVVSE
jgi:recombinational DNA repair ATPase RecF